MPLKTSTASVKVCLFLLLTFVFYRWQGWATAGRRDPDWPADVLVFVLLDGADARPVRLYRWIERELLCMREAAIARCVRPVTPPP